MAKVDDSEYLLNALYDVRNWDAKTNVFVMYVHHDGEKDWE